METEPLTADTGWAWLKYSPGFSNEKSKTTTTFHLSCLTQLDVPGKNEKKEGRFCRGQREMSFNPVVLCKTL